MEAKPFSFVGPSCGHHASYVFYKAIKYEKNSKSKILSLGEFFFVKIWSDSDLVSIGEVQLFWEDKNTNQILCSLRLYFLPEYTPEGRMIGHGEDELVAVSEKAVLKVTDLLDWIADPADITWDRGLLGVCEEDCEVTPPDASDSPNQVDPGLNSTFQPGHSDFLADVRREKKAIGDVPALDEVAVVILSSSQYARYRAVLKRIGGKEKSLMHKNVIAALGGFTVRTRKTYILFCREHFDYAELEEHPYLCNHLAPKLKGRPRKRKKVRRAGSPAESESASSESSHSSASVQTLQSRNGKNGLKKDLLSILSQKNTKEELDFLKKLTAFMEKRKTPIERPPMLGFKQIDLHLFYQKVEALGGYDGCMGKKAWKSIYDELGGNPQNTSAATCTRRHYEKFLLPFEKHLRGAGEKGRKGPRKKISSESFTDSDKDSKSPGMPSSIASDKESEASPNKSPKTEGNDEPTKTEAEGDIKADLKLAADKLDPALANNPMIAQTLKDMMGAVAAADGKLQIDDLIIIPNVGNPPEGGSALQNLAKIASRYQNSGQAGEASKRERSTSPPGAKRAKVDGDSKQVAASQQLPPSKKQNSGGASMSPNNFLSLIPANLLQAWPGSSSPGKSGVSSPSKSSSSSSNPLAQMAASAGLGNLPLPDPSKLGPEGLSLLRYYEKQLKAMAAQQTLPQSATPPSNPSLSPSPYKNGGRDSANSNVSASSATASRKDRSEKNKVCKPPPETKRPPSLMQTPCAFTQTNRIYGNPMAELKKLREQQPLAVPSVQVAQSGSNALDLTDNFGRSRIESDMSSSLKRESSLPTLDLSLKNETALLARPPSSHMKLESSKASPFSAEALIGSKSSIKPASHHDLVKIAPLSSISRQMDDHRLSSVSRGLASTSVSTSLVSSAKSSPWHTPVLSSPALSSHKEGGKPAIPVSPVVREERKELGSFAGLSGLLPPSSTVTSINTPMSLPLPASSLALASVASSLSHPSLAASNPYLALMSPSAGPSASALAAAAAGKAPGAAGSPAAYPTHLMDPATSAYYAALYSQQMYGAAGLSPFGLGASPGMRGGLPTPGGVPGMDHLQAQVLQAMLARNPGAASAANPFAAGAGGAAGFPGLSSLYPGLGGFPPHRKDP